MTKQSAASLKFFVRQEDPFADLLSLKRRLVKCTSESRYVEWKSYPPLGPSVDVRSKYRVVKAAISFANTDGGFIVFGVSSDGRWTGLTNEQIQHVDPSKITELINGCISPEILYLNYAQLVHRGKYFGILHVPTSPLQPHVTTKEIIDRSRGPKSETILARHAVYCRSGGKSSLASPDQHQRIVAKRTEFLKADLLRRIREVPVAAVGPLGLRTNVQGGVTYARLTDDPKASPIRLTRDRTEAGGVFLHEQISDGLLEEINNVLELNSRLSASQSVFVLGEPVYYRVYAERQHIKEEGRVELLLKTSFTAIYGPSLFWFRVMPTKLVAETIVASFQELKAPYVDTLIRLVTLLGPEMSDWLWEVISELWKGYTQKPEYYWSFQKIRNRSGALDRRLLALRATGRSKIEVPSESEKVTFEVAMEDPKMTATLLSQACMRVFRGEKQWRTPARVLDILAYGSSVEDRGSEILRHIKAMGGIKPSVKEIT